MIRMATKFPMTIPLLLRVSTVISWPELKTLSRIQCDVYDGSKSSTDSCSLNAA